MSSETAEKKFIKEVIQMVGKDDCGACSSFQDHLNTKYIPNNKIPVEFAKVSYDSEEGKKIIQEKKLDQVPYIKRCFIPENKDEEPKCEEYTGFDENNWKIVTEEQKKTEESSK